VSREAAKAAFSRIAQSLGIHAGAARANFASVARVGVLASVARVGGPRRWPVSASVARVRNPARIPATSIHPSI
jgi:hypothetical protein